MENPIKIYTSNQSFEIELMKSKLEENKIESYILNKQDSAYVVIGDLELYVDNKDVERANVILKEANL